MLGEGELAKATALSLEKVMTEAVLDTGQALAMAVSVRIKARAAFAMLMAVVDDIAATETAVTAPIAAVAITTVAIGAVATGAIIVTDGTATVEANTDPDATGNLTDDSGSYFAPN